MFLFVLLLTLHVHQGESINAALDQAREAYAAKQTRTTIYIDPGTYQEELTIDVPHLKLINASPTPSIDMKDCGVRCDENAVRITWYYGHGYQYRSMGDVPNYGGRRTRRWNASVLVTAPYFYAENIIFENSFNLYVSEKEARDSLVDISQSDLEWTEKERPKKQMPERPKIIGSYEVQRKAYRERAAAISFTETARHAHLKNCRAVGRQDVVYGDQGASVWWEEGILCGGVDFIFGAMQFVADRSTIVAYINGEEKDKCYISAGRSGSDPDGKQITANGRGMLFYKCHIRKANSDELTPYASTWGWRDPNHPECLVWLARPWRWWGQTVWAYTTWDKGTVNAEAWHTGLTKGQECPNSYEYRSQDGSVGRPKWVQVLSRPYLPDGTRICPRNWK